MSTLLIRTNGVTFANIPDRLILGPNVNNKFKTPINLIGQSHISYGKAQNENYLWLTENFTNTNAPANIKGQRWFKPHEGYGGEYLISPADRTSDANWLTIPLISTVTSEPLANTSYDGRMLITGLSTLKMKINGAWATIPTTVTGNKYYSELITIRYDSDDGAIIHVPNATYDGTSDTSVTESVHSITQPADSWVDIGRFDAGGIYDEDLDTIISAYTTLQYGGSYTWQAEVVARDAYDNSKHKSWSLTGTLSVLSSEEQTTKLTAMALLPEYSGLYLKADPRLLMESFLDTGETESDKIDRYNLNIIKHTEYQTTGTEDWDIRINPVQDFRIESEITNNVSELIGDASIYGLMFQGLTTSSESLQWSIGFTIQGIPNEIV